MTPDRGLTPYIPLLVVLALPALVCLTIMLVEPGINRSMLTHAIGTFAVLGVIAVVLSFGAAKYWGDT